MWGSSALALAVLVIGCAKATPSNGDNNGNGNDANGGGPRDAPDKPIDAPNKPIDAPNKPIDAMTGGTMMATLSETTNSTLVFGTNCCSVACSVTATGNTHDNQWYRAFQLSDFAQVTGAFHVSSVTFGVQEAKAAGSATVSVGTYTGAMDATTLDTTMITQLATATATIADAVGPPGEKVTVPIDAMIPAGGKFVVEIAMPDLDPNGTNAQGFYMYIGATTAGQTHDGYIGSTACGVGSPEATQAASATSGQLIIDVTGTY